MVEKRRILLVALTPLGWGETAFAIHLGKALQQDGNEVRVVTHAATATLFAGTGLPYEPIVETMLPLLPLLLDAIFKEMRPHTIVLCDIATTERAFRYVRADPDMLFRYDAAVVGVDTWDAALTGSTIDLFCDETMPVATWLDEVPLRLKPVPFLSPTCGAGACQYLPAPARVPKRVRDHVRREFGAGTDQRVVLFCTASWQHFKYNNVDGERLAAQLPLLAARYLALLGKRVHLVHIGPAAYPLDEILQGCYHWMPPQSAEVLNVTMAAADLLLSANASAATIGKAIVSGLPVVVLQNSIRADCWDDAIAQLASPALPDVIGWLDATVPLYPFTLWPLGYQKYLEPLFVDNPYRSAVVTVELCDGQVALETFERLLFDATSFERLRCAQGAYVDQVLRLPKAATLFDHLIKGTNADPGSHQVCRS